MTTIDSTAGRLESLIRESLGRSTTHTESLARTPGISRVIVVWIVSGLFYGSVMGSFGGFAGDRLLQVFYSAVKVPLLFSATFILALPALYVIASLVGLRHAYFPMLAALVRTQAGVSVVLASLAPFTAVWYASFDGYSAAILLNFATFSLASLSGQSILRRQVGPLIQREPRVRWLVVVWIFLYGFVGIQMGWVLRPFIGSPGDPVMFVRGSKLGNAYIALWSLIVNTAQGQ